MTLPIAKFLLVGTISFHNDYGHGERYTHLEIPFESRKECIQAVKAISNTSAYYVEGLSCSPFMGNTKSLVQAPHFKQK